MWFVKLWDKDEFEDMKISQSIIALQLWIEERIGKCSFVKSSSSDGCSIHHKGDEIGHILYQEKIWKKNFVAL